MQRLLDGDWKAEDFLVVPSGQTIRDDVTDPAIITTEPHCSQCGSHEPPSGDLE
jgi:hypothetical protein